MNRSTRIQVLLVLAALPPIALFAAVRPLVAAAPRDVMDWPIRLTVGGASEVLVAMGTDTGTGAVVRLSSDGKWLGRWAVGRPIADIAAGPDDRVYVGLANTGQVLAAGPDGAGQAMWAVSGTVKSLAVGPYGDSPGGSVYILAASSPTGTPEPAGRSVLRRSPVGEPVGAWPVEDTAYDLASGRLSDTVGDGLVFVADAAPLATPRAAGTSRLAIYGVDGTLRTSAEQRFLIAGLGVWPLHQTCLGLTPRISLFSLADCVDGDGVSTNQFPLSEGALLDMAVDPVAGFVYAILDDYVVRFSAAGTPLGRVTREQLNRWATATPSPSPTLPPPSQTPTSATVTPTPSATLTIQPTATAPSSSTPSETPTERATQTLAPPRWTTYLPFASQVMVVVP